MKLYVYYNPPDGVILSIGPDKLPNRAHTHIILDTPLCNDLYTGKLLIAKHRVIHGTLTDNVTDLLLKHGALPEPNSIIRNYSHQRVFHVPLVDTLDDHVDLTVRNNTKAQEITFTLGPWANVRALENTHFFFTDRDDLYRCRHVIKLPLFGVDTSKQLTVYYDQDLSGCSLWTYRIFETYQYQEYQSHAVFGLGRLLSKLRRTELRKALGRFVDQGAWGQAGSWGSWFGRRS